MTAANPGVALTEIATLFTSGFAGPVDLPNKDFDAPTDTGTVWARMRFQHTGNGQGSLSNAGGQRRWQGDGFCTINMHFPLGGGVREAYEQADAVAALFRGKRTPSDVWFRNVSVIEPDRQPASKHYVLDVVFDFTYDQIQ